VHRPKKLQTAITKAITSKIFLDDLEVCESPIFMQLFSPMAVWLPDAINYQPGNAV
jgi:hypothetical protein